MDTTKEQREQTVPKIRIVIRSANYQIEVQTLGKDGEWTDNYSTIGFYGMSKRSLAEGLSQLPAKLDCEFEGNVQDLIDFERQVMTEILDKLTTFGIKNR